MQNRVSTGIFRDSEVERERACSSFWGFYLGSNFDLYSKGDFLTKMVEVGVDGHLWKAQWKEKPNDEGRKKLTM